MRDPGVLEKLGVGPVAGVEGARLEREEERKERSVTCTPITRTFSLIYTALPMGWWNPEKLQSWAFAIPGPLVGDRGQILQPMWSRPE